MGLLTPKGKKGDKKNTKPTTNNANAQGSKFMSKGVKSDAKKQVQGRAQRGS